MKKLLPGHKKNNKFSTKINKWGNGYGIRIPVSILGYASINIDSQVQVQYLNDSISITQQEKGVENLMLKDILRGVSIEKLREDESADNLFGKRVGNEIW